MPDDSVRSHLEAIRDCKPHRLPGEVYQHAVAALRLLDEAARYMDAPNVGPPGVAHVRVYSGYRLVADSVCGASTDNTP